MELALFQLENLLLTRTRFCFLDLRRSDTRRKDSPRREELQSILAQAEPIAAELEVIEAHLREKLIAPSFPIVMVCDNGKVSAKLARKLEAKGFQNVYVVKRGAEGLESDL